MIKGGRKNVVAVIYNLYDLDFWKIIIIWNQSGLGNLKVFAYNCIAASDTDRDGDRWIDLHSISDFDCGSNCFIDSTKSIMKSGFLVCF